MEYKVLELTVSPAVPLHWLMFVLGSASNISTTFHNLLDAGGGHDDDHGDGVVVEVVGDDFLQDLVLPTGDGLHEAGYTLPVITL